MKVTVFARARKAVLLISLAHKTRYKGAMCAQNLKSPQKTTPDTPLDPSPTDKTLAPLAAALTALQANPGETAQKSLPPIERWHPPFCGQIPMRIAADGTWFYNGTPIARPALVALFASVLRFAHNRYELVTPVECVEITVEDLPFLAVQMRPTATGLSIHTALGDGVEIGPQHPLRFDLDRQGGFKPAVLVRRGLWARFSRALAFDLVDHLQPAPHPALLPHPALAPLPPKHEPVLGIASQGAFFSLPTEPLPVEPLPAKSMLAGPLS